MNKMEQIYTLFDGVFEVIDKRVATLAENDDDVSLYKLGEVCRLRSVVAALLDNIDEILHTTV